MRWHFWCALAIGIGVSTLAHAQGQELDNGPVTITDTTASALDVGGGIVAGTGNVQIVSAAGEILDAALSSNIPLLDDNNVFAGTVTIELGDTQLRFDETDAAANNQNWLLRANGEQFTASVFSDDWVSGVTFLRVDRTANVLDSFAILNTPVNIGQVNGHSIGTATPALSAQLNLTGSFSSAAQAINISTTMTGVSGTNMFGLFLRPTMTEPPSGVVSLVSVLDVSPSWAADAGGSFNTTRVAFFGRPSTLGTSANYGLYIDGEPDDVHVLGDAGGKFLIGDTSSNELDTGLVIRNTSLGDTHVLVLKDETTSHAHAGFEADTYAAFRVNSSSDGGMIVDTVSGSTTGASFFLAATVESGWASTTKGVTTNAIIDLRAYENNTTPDGTTENLFGVFAGNVAHLLLDQVGLYLNGTSNASAFDEYEDVYMARALDLETATRGLVRTPLDRAVPYTREDLVASGILTDGGFINVLAHSRLLNGALWQLHQALERATDRIEQLEAR